MAKMTEFDYDVRDRKRVASMAKYKKNGSKSKKCSLPSDGMTKKQWKERCGELMSFNIKKPMSWEQFKSMSHDLQKEYVTSLTTTYKVGLPKVADMLGCCEASLRNYLKKHVPDFVSGSSKGRLSKENMEAWAEFLKTGEPVKATTESEIQVEVVAEATTEATAAVQEINVPVEVVEPVQSETAVVEQEVIRVEEEPVVKPKKVKPAHRPKDEKRTSLLREFSLIFEGNVNPMEIANSLTAILGSGAAGRIEVRYAM